MALRSQESALVAAGVLVVVSWLSTIYLVRQNRALRRLHHDGDNEHDKDSLNSEPDSRDRRNDTENESENHESNGRDRFFVMEEIGIIQSPFPQRAGCPRQGTLAPHVKSFFILHPHVPREVLDGIKLYSHVWIIFSFHLNPRGKAKSGGESSKSANKFNATKVRPPRANGVKMGVLATRAPHRPNPVGLSLAFIEDVLVVQGTQRKQTRVVLRGLDLVDGTPVYDIKPYVPWDRIPHSVPAASSVGLHEQMKHMRVPTWVSADDELAQVVFSQSATAQMHEARDCLPPLYPSTDEGVEEACRAIEEIIAQDPRAMRDGRGKPSVEFEFTFGSLRICFDVLTQGLTQQAEVTSVEVDNGDISAAKGSYPHSLALRRRAEAEARQNGTKVVWASPVREGIIEDLFDLHHGGTWKTDGVPN